MDDQHRHIRAGYVAGIGAGLVWGLLPLYIRLLSAFAPLWFVAQRVLWSLLFVGIIMLCRREVSAFLALLRRPKIIWPIAISAFLIALNWSTYVFAVSLHHVLATSLGYFLSPLVSVMLGVIFLGEKLNRAQWAAVIVAFSGAALLAVSALDTLWISLTLAMSFALYAFVRKTAPIDALPGLALETLILAPFASAYVLLASPWAGGAEPSASAYWLLPLSGIITSVPLLLFAFSSRRLPLVTLGLLQYMPPTLQFLLGIFLFGEPFGGTKLASFLIVWVGLAIFTWDAIRRGRLARQAGLSR